MSKEVEALIKAAKARAYQEAGARGAHGGPKVKSGMLPPHGSAKYTISFDSHTMASIGFHSSATLRVKMHSGGFDHFNQVTTTGHYTWVPHASRTMAATYVISNGHSFPVKYRLWTN
jgi:hypothetical protein